MIAKLLLRRFLSLIPILLGITFLSFLLMSMAPGDFATGLALNAAISQDRIAQIRDEFGLDQPWYRQYLIWLYRISPFEFPAGLKMPDFGYSFASKTPVLDLLPQRFLNTLFLSGSAAMIAWGFAIPAGLLLAARRYTWIDRISSDTLILGISVPQILLCLLALLLAAKTGWFPIGGMRSIDYASLSFWGRIGDLLHHLFLPAVVLAVSEAFALMRYMRQSTVEVLSADFIQTARTKGLSEHRVLLKHAFPNALNPLLPLVGLSFADLVGGSVLVEIIFGWPGMGRLMYESILARDVYVVMATLTISTFFLVLGNLVADLLLSASDPRIRDEQ